MSSTPSHDSIFAVDFGGTGTVIGLVHRAGRILGRSQFRTREFVRLGEPEVFARQVIAQAKSLASDLGFDAPSQLGIGAPGGNYFTGEVCDSPNLAWRGTTPLAQMLGAASGWEIRLENDANASALGEARFGLGPKVTDFVAVTLGTGVGSGIFAGGQLLRGVDGFGGELGHFNVVPKGRHCHCGGAGCLETYASATGLIRTVLTGIRNGASGATDFQAAQLESDPEAAGKQIAKLAAAGNPLARDAFDVAAKSLAKAFTELTGLLSPACFVLSGGLSQAGAVLTEPLEQAYQRSCLRFQRPLPRILCSDLGPGDAALLGAASLFFS